MIALTCVAAMVVAAAGLPANVERLGQPCRAKNILSGRAVTDRTTGREMLAMVNMNEDTGAELIFVDYEKEAGTLYHAPAGSGSWALDEVPGDRMVVGTFYDGRFMVFDLKKMEFAQNIDFPGETYIWNLATGSDGRIYGGTYPHGKLGALDLNTYAVEDCGAPAAPNMYLRYVSATPDGRILCNFGMEKPVNMLYDPQTKAFSPVPRHLEGITQGATWNGYYLAGSMVCDAKTLELVGPPFPTPPAENGEWSVDAYTTTSDRLVLRQGNAIYTYKTGDKDLTLVCDIPLRGRLMAIGRNGEALGLRGQDYFVVRPGDKSFELKPIPVEAGPRPTLFLEVDARGRLWGGPHFGQTLFWMDPATRKYVNTGIICDSGGEVYDVAFVNGKVYAVAYAGGDIVRYDPEAAWDQWNNVNPTVAADVGSKGYIRPVGGIRLGPDGKLYSGWMAKYGTYGGAVAITDPASGETEMIENPLGEQAVAGVAADAKFIYVGTSLGANGLPNKKGEWAGFGIVEKATKKAVLQRTMEGASQVGRFAFDAGAKRLALSVNASVRIFDTEDQRMLDDLTKDAPAVSTNCVAAPGNGFAYYGSERSVVRMDLATGKTETLAEMPGNVTTLAAGADGTVYAACGVDVYAVRAN